MHPKQLGEMVSAFLTFIGYRQTNNMYIYIYMVFIIITFIYIYMTYKYNVYILIYSKHYQYMLVKK